jgi:hypothetical protein
MALAVTTVQELLSGVYTLPQCLSPAEQLSLAYFLTQVANRTAQEITETRRGQGAVVRDNGSVEMDLDFLRHWQQRHSDSRLQV